MAKLQKPSLPTNNPFSNERSQDLDTSSKGVFESFRAASDDEPVGFATNNIMRQLAALSALAPSSQATKPDGEAGFNLQELRQAAELLNRSTDELAARVGEIEDAINALNLGISEDLECEIVSDDDHPEASTVLKLGYGKIGAKWGFVVDEIKYEYGEQAGRKIWFFKEAPRDLRLKVVEKIPALISAMTKHAKEAADQIVAKAHFAQRLASVFKSAEGSK